MSETTQSARQVPTTPAIKLTSVACHPGYSATNLQAMGPRMQGSSLRESMMAALNVLFSQTAAMGTLPTLYAATSPDVKGRDYIGPDTLELWGHPKKVSSSAAAHDTAAAARLWQVSEELTGVRYSALL